MSSQKILRKKLRLFRTAGIAEGTSFLVLLLIAMPLKYRFEFPLAVTIVGWIHGILFVAFVSLAWDVKSELNKPLKWFLAAFGAALIPAGTFFFDKEIRKELNQPSATTK